MSLGSFILMARRMGTSVRLIAHHSPRGQSGAGGGKRMREGSAGQTTQRAATTRDFQSARVLESTAAAVRPALTMRTVHNEGQGGFAGLLTEQARRTGLGPAPRATARSAGRPGTRSTQRPCSGCSLNAPAGTAWHARGCGRAGRPFPLLQRPHHRPHPAPPPKRRHDTTRHPCRRPANITPDQRKYGQHLRNDNSFSALQRTLVHRQSPLPSPPCPLPPVAATTRPVGCRTGATR